MDRQETGNQVVSSLRSKGGRNIDRRFFNVEWKVSIVFKEMKKKKG